MGARLNDLIKKIKQNETVIVYGAGNNAAPVIEWLNGNDEFDSIEKIVAVTNPKNNQMFRGFAVQKIDDLCDMADSALVLVAVFKAFIADIDSKLSSFHFQNIVHIEDWFVEEAYYERLWNFPIEDHKILVENFHGLGYGDSPKYVVEELLKQRSDLDIVWVTKPGLDAQVPACVRCVEIYSEQFYYEVATSRIWISNVRKYQSVRKRPGQYYIQTWHGLPLKKIEKDAEEISHGVSAPYFDAGQRDSKMIDLAISNAVFLTSIFKNGFWYDGDVLECGAPRNDVFFKNTETLGNKVREFYGIDGEEKILIYAPTFRINYEDDPLGIQIHDVLRLLEEKTGERWVSLMRMHPNIAKKAGLFTYSDRVINATDYPDVMELLCAGDALITDYSSIMYDFMLTGNPVFLFAKDRERYASNDRGFYIEYESLPFAIAVSNEELLNNIRQFDDHNYKNKLKSFYDMIGFCDSGIAAESIVSKINEVLEG